MLTESECMDLGPAARESIRGHPTHRLSLLPLCCRLKALYQQTTELELQRKHGTQMRCSWRTSSPYLCPLALCACVLLGPHRLWRKGALAADLNAPAAECKYSATCWCCCHQLEASRCQLCGARCGRSGLWHRMRPMPAWSSVNPRANFHGALGRWQHLPLQQFTGCICPHIACRFGFHFSQPTRGWWDPCGTVVADSGVSNTFQAIPLQSGQSQATNESASWLDPKHFPLPCRAALPCFDRNVSGREAHRRLAPREARQQ